MTLTVAQITSEKTSPLLQRYAADYYCLELLRFFDRYPRARFSRLAIVHALNNGKVCVIEKALQRLISDGLVNKHSENNVTFYSLA